MLAKLGCLFNNNVFILFYKTEYLTKPTSGKQTNRIHYNKDPTLKPRAWTSTLRYHPIKYAMVLPPFFVAITPWLMKNQMKTEPIQ